ncbi:hypothetical protein ABE21_27300 [Bacillus thuringiensis]|nr:hypothetical protein [Bacillus thuringiensis]
MHKILYKFLMIWSKGPIEVLSLVIPAYTSKRGILCRNMTYIYIAIHVSYASFVFTWIAWAYTEKETRIRTKYRKKQGMDGEWNFVNL